MRTVSKGLNENDAVLSHVMCDLGNSENYTEPPPNNIEDYGTENKLFTVEYIFIREAIRENIVS